MTTGRWTARLAATALLIVVAACPVAAAGKPYRLPATDLKQRVIWGAVCERPDGTGLAFGGQDQQADDGRPHTRIKTGGQWVCIRDDLRAANPLQTFHDRLWDISRHYARSIARTRALHFKGLPVEEVRQRVERELTPHWAKTIQPLARLTIDLVHLRELADYDARQVQEARKWLGEATRRSEEVEGPPQACVKPANIAAAGVVRIGLGQAAEALDAEPPPRALSPIVYEPKTGLYVVFGGDHLDYLMNDTWVFDPKAPRWMQRHPPSAPPPRANHTLRATGDGKVLLSGGYAYASNTDYMGGQYVELDDGEWTYDVAADSWAGSRDGVPPDARVYRSGPFHPDFYFGGMGGDPDAAAHEKVLAALPVNRWVRLEPPAVPRQNRDWGTVRLDPDRDLILVWSGGHCAHGGTDVLHYHLSTNRWELPFAVEFPLGQLYANTNYPDGFNFNRRPWVTGHTYLSYEVDPVTKRMLFVGRPTHYYVYDPDVAEWVGRAEKPRGMAYGDCFYDLELAATPHGIFCWGKGPKVHRFDPKAPAWEAVEVSGDLPDPAVDYSTIVYDAKRDRLLLLRTGYGKPYDGQVHELDLKTRRVRPLAPTNMAAVASQQFLIDRACYDPTHDLVLLCSLLPADGDGLRRQPAYDPAANRWVSLRIAYDTDQGGRALAPTAVRRSVGLVYDARRKLFWGVDTNRVEVYVLKFDAATADVAALE